MLRWAVPLGVLATTGCADVLGLSPIEELPTTCFGLYGELGAGLFEACVVESQVADTPSFGTRIHTRDDCTSVAMQRDADAPEVCIVAARNIHVQFETVVIGPRPLVLLALESLLVSGTLDASSPRGEPDGAGSGYRGCTIPDGDNDGNGSGGGGAGGTFGSSGGSGGTGSIAGPGGTADAIPDGPDVLRGGCDGGTGGAGSGGAEGGDDGTGGGAMYLIAGGSIEIRGMLAASGGAGAGGAADSSGRASGGGGGGSGGLLGLDAPMVTIASSAILVANGAGGGGGGASGSAGANGGNVDLASSFPFVAAGGLGAGAGGNGGARDVPASAGASGTDVGGAGGGGGGGHGHVVVYGVDVVIDPGAQLSPDVTR